MREEFVKSAIFGTDHYKSADRQAQDLLQYFAIDALQNQAGYVIPKTTSTLPKAARSECKRVCDEKFVKIFQELRNNRQYSHTYSLLPLWIKKFDEAEWRLANELMPHFIEKKRVSFQDMSLLFGEHFVWLIQNTDYAKGILGRKSISKHNVAFLSLHRYHAEEALSWLEGHWSELNVKQKHYYLEMMLKHPNQADIPFLTKVFRSSTKRLVLFYTAKLLSLLNAQVIQRLIDVILDMTHFDYVSSYEVPVVDFVWSQVFTDLGLKSKEDSWEDLGKAKGQVMSIEQLLEIIPMEIWCRHWDVTFEDLLEATYNGKNTNLFFGAWKNRIILERHQTYAQSMLNFVDSKFYLQEKLTREDFLEVFSFEYIQDYVEEMLEL